MIIIRETIVEYEHSPVFPNGGRVGQLCEEMYLNKRVALLQEVVKPFFF